MLDPFDPSRHMNSAEKRALLTSLSEAQNHRCCYCHRETRIGDADDGADAGLKATFEHVVPKSHFRGVGLEGVDRAMAHSHWGNLVMACRECNATRGDEMPAEEYYDLRQDEDAWRAFRRERGYDLTPEERQARQTAREVEGAFKLAFLGLAVPEVGRFIASLGESEFDLMARHDPRRRFRAHAA